MDSEQPRGAEQAGRDDEPTATEVAPGGPLPPWRSRRILALCALLLVAMVLGVLSVVVGRTLVSRGDGPSKPRKASASAASSSSSSAVRRQGGRDQPVGWMGICEQYGRGRLDRAVAASEREQPAPISRQDRIWLIEKTCEPYRELLEACRRIQRNGLEAAVPSGLAPEVRAEYVRELKAVCGDAAR